MRNTVLIATYCLLLPFAGCTKYNPRRTTLEKKTFCEYKTTSKNYRLNARISNAEDIKYHFPLFKLIELTVQNRTIKPCIINDTHFSLPLASQKKIAQHEPKLYTRYTIPSILALFGGILFAWELIIPGAGGLALLAGQASSKNNKQHMNYLKKITLFAKGNITIKPMTTKKFLIFIENKYYYPRFNITLESPDQTNTTHIPVSMTSRSHSYIKIV